MFNASLSMSLAAVHSILVVASVGGRLGASASTCPSRAGPAAKAAAPPRLATPSGAQEVAADPVR